MEEGSTRRLYLLDGRGDDRHLRVTWHPETKTMVFSHWRGDVCTASTPVSLDDATRLVGFIVGALAEVAARRVSPSDIPAPPRTWLRRLRDRLWAPVAPIVSASERFRPPETAKEDRSA
jgi:hypothetical protein